MYHIYMPVDMVVMLSTNKYRRYYKKEQTNDKLLDKLLEKKSCKLKIRIRHV